MPAAPSRPAKLKREPSTEKNAEQERKPSPPEQRPVSVAKPVGGVALPKLDGSNIKPLRPAVSPRPAQEKRAEQVAQTPSPREVDAASSIKLADAVQRLLAAHGARLDGLGIRAVMEALEAILRKFGPTGPNLEQTLKEAVLKLPLMQRVQLVETADRLMPELEDFQDHGPLLQVAAELCATSLKEHFAQRETVLRFEAKAD